MRPKVGRASKPIVRSHRQVLYWCHAAGATSIQAAELVVRANRAFGTAFSMKAGSAYQLSDLRAAGPQQPRRAVRPPPGGGRRWRDGGAQPRGPTIMMVAVRPAVPAPQHAADPGKL
eukprot:gene773-biopygen1360